MNMQACPPEIHSYICQLAGLDDGRTIRALSLVSIHFNEIARTYIYQSLSVAGPDQISTLTSKLEITPPHLRHIRHLFLSDQVPEKPDCKPSNPSPTIDPTAVTRILTLVAPTLETLTFISSNPNTSTKSIARLFRLPFPRLHELTVSGFYPFPSLPGKFPRLTHLHLHGNRNPHGLLQLGGLDEACPCLTHLRVSGLSMAVSFAQELQEAFWGDEETMSLFPSRLPPYVEHVVVQPGSPGPAGKLSTATLHKREEAMREQLVAVRAFATSGVRFDVLEGSDVRPPLEAFKRDWVARLEGGHGGWA
jgi:hypothetical protein